MKNKLYSILNFYIRLDLVLIFMTILESLVLSILSSMEHGLELTKYLENGSSKKILGMIYMMRRIEALEADMKYDYHYDSNSYSDN